MIDAILDFLWRGMPVWFGILAAWLHYRWKDTP